MNQKYIYIYKQKPRAGRVWHCLKKIYIDFLFIWFNV